MSDWQETYYENYYQEFDYYLKLWSAEDEKQYKREYKDLESVDD